MAMLILRFDDDESLELPTDGNILIGSDEDTDVLIDHPGVAARHAEISADSDGTCWIRDLASATGTFVNSQRVEFRRLERGDELRFGPVAARFMGLEKPIAPRSPAAHVDTTPILLPQAPPPSPTGAADPQRPTDPVPSSPEPALAPAAAPAPSPAKGDTAESTEPASAPLRPVMGGEAASSRQGQAPVPNQRRGDYLMRLFFLVVIANGLLFVACAFWFYGKTRDDLQTTLAALGLHEHRPATANPAPAPKPAAAAPVPDTRSAAEMAELREQMDSLGSALESLKKSVARGEDQANKTAKEIADLTARLPEIAKNRETPPATTPAVEGAATPSQSELVLLKERNRLTAYADEAIATGARGPYERLWDAIEDPRMVTLVHAARAEILRVQDCFINGQRVKFHGIQQHQIPVSDIFPDSSALAPAQLSDDQLIEVLQNQKLSWQTRVKAAWHLGQRRSTKVGDALVKAVKTDPMLDVVAEATFSFEQITGYHAKLFDVPSLEAWWKTYNEKALVPPAAPKSPPAGDPADKLKQN